MIIEKDAAPIDLRAGVYQHYKGKLYLVEGYSHNASDSNRIQISYVPLYTDRDEPGPRRATRDWQEFFETICMFHHGVPCYTDDHNDLRRGDTIEATCQGDRDWVDRFVYKGPVYYAGMESNGRN